MEISITGIESIGQGTQGLVCSIPFLTFEHGSLCPVFYILLEVGTGGQMTKLPFLYGICQPSWGQLTLSGWALRAVPLQAILGPSLALLQSCAPSRWRHSAYSVCETTGERRLQEIIPSRVLLGL